MLCVWNGRASGILKRPWNGNHRAAELGEAHGGLQHGMAFGAGRKLSEAYAHYRKSAADENDDSAWWALGRFMKTASPLHRTERKRAAAMKLARNWAGEMQNALGALQALGIGGRRQRKPV